MWTCPKCRSVVDESFDVCWKCGTSKEGVEDPTFVSADDVGPLEGEEPMLAALQAEDSAAAQVEAIPPVDMREVYVAATLAEARFVADQLLGQGIPALAHSLESTDPLKLIDPKEQAHVVVRAEDIERARAFIQQHHVRARAQEVHGALGQDIVECYRALNYVEARFIADQLTAEGIPATADTEDMRAELGSMTSAPRVWVRARDYTRAREWCEEYDRHKQAQHPATG
jgi:hypothetical protein